MDAGFITNLISTVFAKLTGFKYNIINPAPVPVGVSNRHLHLSQKDMDVLFGEGYTLSPVKELSQPGQFAAKETVTIAGPRGSIENVRVLGPCRGQTQIEIMRSDCFKLGVDAPVRESGNVAGSAPATVIGPKGSVYIKEGVIVAKRHIHMALTDAESYGVADGQIVSVRTSGERAIVYDNVVVRAGDKYALEAHFDLDEANAADLKNGDGVYIVTGKFGASSGLPGVQERPGVQYIDLVTEDSVRAAARKGEKLYVAKGAIYTPLARDYIKEFNVTVIEQ